jgi:hypothetical protein
MWSCGHEILIKGIAKIVLDQIAVYTLLGEVDFNISFSLMIISQRPHDMVDQLSQQTL